MKCREINDSLVAYLHGEATPSEQTLIRAHLARCDTCRNELSALSKIHERIGQLLKPRPVPLAPSPYAWEKLQATLEREGRSPVRRFFRRWRQWRATHTPPHTSRQRRPAAAILTISILVALLSLLLVWPEARMTLSRAVRGVLAPYWEATRSSVEPTPSPSPVPTGQPAQETPRPSPMPTARTDEPVTITFACPEYEAEVFTGLAEDFERANPNIHVQIIPTDELRFESLTTVADTFVNFASFTTDDWFFLLDLRPFVEDPTFPADDFFPGTLDHFRWQGGVYGLPAMTVPFFIFYDRAMFDQAGLSYPQAGWTWDELLEVAVQLTERNGEVLDRYGFVDPQFHKTVLAVMQQHGVLLWDEGIEPPQPRFDTPEVATVLRRYTDLALTYEVMPIPELGSSVMADTLINERKAAMWTDFGFNRNYHARRTDLGLVPFPEGEAAANPLFIDGFFVSAGTAHPQAAWRWLGFLSANYFSASYGPKVSDCLPGRRSIAEQLPWWIQLDEETRAIYEYTLAHPLTNDNPLTALPLLKAAVAIFEDGLAVEEALELAQELALQEQSYLAETMPPTPLPVAAPPLVPEPGKGQTVITFTAGREDQELYRELAARFQEVYPDIWVEVVIAASDGLGELAQASDCFFRSADLAQYATYRQHIRALGPFLDLDPDFDLADYYPQFLAPLQQEGELWGLPYQADAAMVYLNLERFAEVGIAPPEWGWSTDDFLSIATALSDNSHYGFTTAKCAYGSLLFVLEQLGAHLLDETQDPPVPTLTDPTVIAALERYANLSRDRSLFPATPGRECGWPTSSISGLHPAGVASGDVAMWVESVRKYSVAPPLSFETGAAPLPMGATPSNDFYIQSYFISAYTSKPQACWEWLSFLSEQPEVVQWRLPTRRTIAASPVWQGQVEEALLPAYLATLEYYQDQDSLLLSLSSVYTSLTYAYPWLNEAFEATLGGEDAAIALAEAQVKAEALLACLEAAGSSIDDAEMLLACARQVDPSYPPVFTPGE